MRYSVIRRAQPGLPFKFAKGALKLDQARLDAQFILAIPSKGHPIHDLSAG